MTGCVSVRYASGDIMELEFSQFYNETSASVFEELNITKSFDDCILSNDQIDPR